MGLEPTISRATIWRSNQLNYTHLARLNGFEPLTHCLEGSCSIQLSYRRIKVLNFFQPININILHTNCQELIFK